MFYFSFFKIHIQRQWNRPCNLTSVSFCHRIKESEPQKQEVMPLRLPPNPEAQPLHLSIAANSTAICRWCLVKNGIVHMHQETAIGPSLVHSEQLWCTFEEQRELQVTIEGCKLRTSSDFVFCFPGMETQTFHIFRDKSPKFIVLFKKCSGHSFCHHH